MSNEIIKYDNRMNDVSFYNFKSVELDLFFSICYKMKEKKTELICLTFDELKKLINYKFTGNDRFYNDLKAMYRKLINLSISFETGERGKRIWTEFILFIKYVVDEQEKTVKIKINPDFYYILNEITTNFTRFELSEFTKLKSIYSKQMFKLLAQYNTTGIYNISIDDFRKKLDIPRSYRMTHINKSVLTPILTELPSYFKNLKLEKIKKGRNIDRLKFTFSPRKERTLGFKNGNPVTADERSFEEVQEERRNTTREEFESLDRAEQARLVREQLKKRL